MDELEEPTAGLVEPRSSEQAMSSARDSTSTAGDDMLLGLMDAAGGVAG
eukprot:CAMPEP_0183797464 /NCGR_PEP_ID=MMETSP0803_2-20130417/15917_1 /TAXON_ID=195967 /ORGANISM="Crustomastix stigmata, Strain CCMP3273" /LENGTH=48 /DNA_ID= /DNA_START= /DNA_END= /DNA_ORIENTATION=